jgi:golgin subfamily B member 1
MLPAADRRFRKSGMNSRRWWKDSATLLGSRSRESDMPTIPPIPPRAPSRRPLISLRPEELMVELEQFLEHPDAVLEALVASLAKGNVQNDLWEALHRAAERDRREPDLAFAYEQVTHDRRARLLNHDAQVELFDRAATFFSVIFHDLDTAISHAEKVLALAPSRIENVERLENWLHTQARLARLGRMHVTLAKATQEPEARRSHLEQAFHHAQQEQNDSAAAIEVLELVLQLDPTLDGVAEAVENQLLAAGRFRDAARRMETRLAHGSLSDQQLVGLRERLLDLYTRDLPEPPKAMAQVEAILPLKPDHDRALTAAEKLCTVSLMAPRALAVLSSAHERLGNLERAASLLTQELKIARGPHRNDVARRLAVLREEVLEDPAGALELLGPVVVGDPSDDDARERFVRLSLALDRAVEAARQLGRAVQTVKDPTTRVRMSVDLGVLQRRTGELRRARSAFEAALRAAADERCTLRAARELTEIYAQSGEWRPLAEALAVVARLETDKDGRHEAARRLIVLWEQELGEPEKAVVGWRALVDAEEADEVLLKLQAHAEQSGDTRDLGQVLAMRAARETDPQERARLDIQATELVTQTGASRPEAILAWQGVIERHGPIETALEHLITLLEAENRTGELAHAIEQRLETCQGPERARLLVRLARLHASELGDHTTAVRVYGAAIAIDPEERTARAELTKYLAVKDVRAAAVAILEPVLRSEKPSRLLVDVLRARATDLVDSQERVDAKAEAFEIARTFLGKLDEAFAIAVDALGDAVRFCPERIDEFVSCCRQTKDGVDSDTRARLLTAVLDGVPLDSPERRSVAALVADALAENAEPAHAIELLRRALAEEPSSPELLGRMDDLLAAAASPSERLALYTQALEREAGGERRRDILARMAALMQGELQQPDRAVAIWQEVLALDETHLRAHQALLALYAEQGDDVNLKAELVRALPFATGERQKALLDRLVEVSLRVDGPKQALEFSLRSHDLPGADDMPRLLRSERLARELARFDVVEQLLQVRLTNLDDPAGRIELLAALGAVRMTLKLTTFAAEAFAHAGTLAGEVGQWERATELFESAIDADESLPSIVTKLWDACARTLQVARLERPLAHMLALGVEEKDVIRRLTDLAGRGLTQETSLPFARLVEMVLEQSTDPARRRQLLLLLAGAYAKNPETQGLAADVYRQLIDASGTRDEETWTGYAALLEQVPDTPAWRDKCRVFYEKRVALASDPVPELVEWARIEQQRFGDRQASRRLFEQVLKIDAERLDVWSELGRLRREAGDIEGLEEALGHLAVLSDDAGQYEVLVERAQLLVGPLDRPDEALDVIESLVLAQPGDPALLTIVRRTLDKTTCRSRAAQLLERVAVAVTDNRARAEVLETLIRITSGAGDFDQERARWTLLLLDTQVEDPESTLAIALRLAAELPGQFALWDRAEKAARKLSRPQPVIASYERALEQTQDVELAEEVGRRLVDFHEEWSEDAEHAVPLLERVYAASGAEWAFDRLKLAFNASGRWNELFALYDRALERASNAGYRIEVLREAAMAAKDFANDPDRAIRYFAQLDEITPGDTRVEAAIERLYERQGLTRPLIDLLTRQMQTASGEVLHQLRARIAGLWIDIDEPLPAYAIIEQMLADRKDAVEAIELLERLVELPVSRDSVFPGALTKREKKERKGKPYSVRDKVASVLRHYYESIGRTADIVRMLEIEVQHAVDDSERVERLKRIFRMRLEELDDAKGAFENLTVLVSLEPDVVEHRKTLDELAERTQNRDRQARLLAENAERQGISMLGLVLRVESADVYREHAGDPARAIELYAEVLREAGQAEPVAPKAESGKPSAKEAAAAEALRQKRALALEAARRLDVLLQQADRWIERVDVLEQLAAFESTAEAHRRALLVAAEVSLSRLGDAPRAVRLYRECLADDIADTEARDGLIDALAAAQATTELIAELEARASRSTDDVAARRDRARIAILYETPLDQMEKAILAWRRLRKLHGRDVESFDALVALLTTSKWYEELASLLRTDADVETDQRRAAELRRRLGDLYREQIGDPIEAVRAYVAAEDWELAIGVVRENRSERELARKVCREVFELGVKRWAEGAGDASSPAALAAAWALAELGVRLREVGAYADVVGLLLEGARLPFHRSERRALQRDAAYLCSDQLKDGAQAIEIFKQIFAEDSGDEIAISSVSRFARLLEEVGQQADVVSLWEDQAQVRLRLGDRAMSAALWVRAAALSEERLLDVERAISDYKQGADLGLDAALEALARIYTGQREYLLAANFLERLCAQSSPEALGDRALQLSEVYVAAMRPDKARACLENASTTALHVGPVRRRLGDLYVEAELWEPLAALYALEAGRATDIKERFRLVDAAARVHVERRGDSKSAVPLLEQGVELDPEDAKLRLRLADALMESARPADAATVLRAQLDRYGTRRPKERAVVHFALARALLGLEDRQAALDELVQASRIDPAHPRILHLQARLSLDMGDYPRAERTYRALLLVLGRHDDDDTPSRSEALLDLSIIATKNDDLQRASESIESAFEAATGSTRESLALERGLRSLARYDLLARALRDRLERVTDPSLGATTLGELARVHAEHLGDLREVMAELRQRAEVIEVALEKSALGDEQAWSALGRVYEQLGDAAAESRIAERRVRAWLSGDVAIEDPEPLYRLALARLGAPRTRDEAVELLSRAVAVKPDFERLDAILSPALAADPDWEPGLMLLDQLARSLGRSDLLSRALGKRLLSVSSSPAQFEEALALARKASDFETLERLLSEAANGSLAERLPRPLRAAAELELADIVSARGEIDRALYLRESASEYVDPEQRRRLLLEIAKVASERLQDERRASIIYERLHQENPGDRAIYRPLLEILRSLSDTDRMSVVIARALDVVDDSEDRIQLQLEQSRLALGRGDAGTAADLLRELLRDEPTQSEAALLLAGILERSGRHAELVILLSKQFDLAREARNSEAVQSLGLRIAELYEQQSRFDEGIAALVAVLEWQPGQPQALRAMVRMSEAIGDLEQAARAIELLMAQPGEPDAAQLIERLIWLREQLGDESGVERAMLRAFEAKPEDAELCNLLVARFEARSDAASVIAVLDLAARARPEDSDLALRLAETYRCSGQLEDALAVVEGLAAFGLESPALHRERGRILSLLGRHEEALMELEAGDPTDSSGALALLEGIRLAGPTAPEHWRLQLGLREVSLLEQLGSLEEARQLLDDLDAAYPNHLPVLGAKARLAASSGDLAGAVDAYVDLAEVVEGEELVALVIELGLACEQLGTPERARAALERALSIEPNNIELRNRLAGIYRSLGANRELSGLMLDEARQIEDAALRQARLLEVAELLAGPDGDPIRAEAILEEARRLGPENLEIVILLARTRSQSGRVEEAMNLLNEAVAAQRGRRSRMLARLYQELSRIQLDEGYLTDALDFMTKAAEIDIRNGALAMALGRLALEVDEPDVAQKTFGRAALMKVAEGEVETLEGITKADRAEANYRLAVFAREAGDLRKARMHITKTLGDNPHHDEARALMAEIG